LGAGPIETLCKVNDALTRDLGGNMFISMIYGILDPDRRSINWARAGGTPALRFTTATGELTEIKPPGMVLGMKSGQIFRQSLKEESTELSAGQTILLYTDGVTESMNAQQEEWGPERLAQLIKDKASGGPEVLLGAIMDEVERFRGDLPVADDLTLLAMAVE
jgi:sigma-B regulation protein RsbU (phosphoserine phosphatase)